MTASTCAGSSAVTARRFGHRGVVDQHIDAASASHASSASGADRLRVSARSATHIIESGEDALTVRQHLGESVAPAGDQTDDRSAFSEGAGQCGADTGRGARDEHPFARRRERHHCRLAPSGQL